MNETERYEMVMERARWLCENSDYLFEKAIEMAEEELELDGEYTIQLLLYLLGDSKFLLAFPS